MDKALVAAILGVLSILSLVFGWHLQWITEEGITAVIAILTPILVYLVPNRVD
jgi:hypothetical protein